MYINSTLREFPTLLEKFPPDWFLLTSSPLNISRRNYEDFSLLLNLTFFSLLFLLQHGVAVSSAQTVCQFQFSRVVALNVTPPDNNKARRKREKSAISVCKTLLRK